MPFLRTCIIENRSSSARVEIADDELRLAGLLQVTLFVRQHDGYSIQDNYMRDRFGVGSNLADNDGDLKADGIVALILIHKKRNYRIACVAKWIMKGVVGFKGIGWQCVSERKSLNT